MCFDSENLLFCIQITMWYTAAVMLCVYLEVASNNNDSPRLKEEGQTALGPALLVSIMLAGKLPGSKVILL